MAEETETKASEPSPAGEVAVSDSKSDEKLPPLSTKEPTLELPPAELTPATTPAEPEVVIQQSVSFKEESNLVGDLPEAERKALDEFKQFILTALSNNEFNPPSKLEIKNEEKGASEPAELKTEEGRAGEPVEVKTEENVTSSSTLEEAFKTEEPKVAGFEEVKEVVVEDDGAKTVEAIEETVVVETEKEAVEEAAAAAAEKQEEELIWGVPLVGHENTDTVLLKFLRARDFKVKDALAMIKDAVIWRKGFGIEKLLEEDLAVPELEKVVFYHGHDKEGHPVCYNVYGEFQSQELYGKAFGDDEKREKFLRWRIQFLEKGIRQQLDFSPRGVSTMVQITDLKNLPGPGKKELRQATKKALALLQDNYPEFVAKQVFINVPWWYLAYNRVMSPFFTQRTKSKFVFAGPSKSAETIFRYISPEQVPVQYGGLSKDNDPEFTTSDVVTEVIIKPSSKHVVELPSIEASFVVWELRVLGWDVSYSAEFVPTSAEGYTVLVQKARKITAADEPYVKNSFKVGEPGKIVLSIDNATTKKKKLLYRSKTKVPTESA